MNALQIIPGEIGIGLGVVLLTGASFFIVRSVLDMATTIQNRYVELLPYTTSDTDNQIIIEQNAKKDAFLVLLSRLNLPPETIANINNDDLSSMVRSERVLDEKIANNTYLATFNIVFANEGRNRYAIFSKIVPQLVKNKIIFEKNGLYYL